jgi:hypothetical protein
MMVRTVLLSAICLLLITAFSAHAGGVRGFVKDEKGEPLAYTTIFVKQTGSGTTTNVNGEYEIALAAGHYELVFQYLGYETVTQQVDISTGFVEVNVTLKTQVTVLQTVTGQGRHRGSLHTPLCGRPLRKRSIICSSSIVIRPAFI